MARGADHEIISRQHEIHQGKPVLGHIDIKESRCRDAPIGDRGNRDAAENRGEAGKGAAGNIGQNAIDDNGLQPGAGE